MISVARFAALLLLVGCGGQTAQSSSAETTIDGAVASHHEGVEGSATSSASEGGGPDAQEVPAPGLTEGPSVWIGQSDRTVTYPWGYDGGPTVPANEPTVTPPQKVVLILNASANPVVGTITFGDDTPPPPASDPTQPYPPEPTTIVDPNGQTAPFGPINPNLVGRPFPGFSYSLVSSTLSGSILELAFVPSQLFQSYCALQRSPQGSPNPAILLGGSLCVCDAGACSAPMSPIRRFELSVSGNTMQGQLSYPAAAALVGTADIRLQRVE